MASPSLEIQHDAARGRFFTTVDARQCEVDYRLDARRMIISHTGVPPQLEGRGIAATLVKHALEWAKLQGLQVVPACSYVRVYLQRHPEYQALTAAREAD